MKRDELFIIDFKTNHISNGISPFTPWFIACNILAVRCVVWTVLSIRSLLFALSTFVKMLLSLRYGFQVTSLNLFNQNQYCLFEMRTIKCSLKQMWPPHA